MALLSKSFLAFILVGLVLFHARLSARWRTAVILGMNVVFVSSFAQSVSELVPLIAFVFFCYVCIRNAQGRYVEGAFIPSLVAIVGAFVYLKQYSFVSFVPGLAEPYVLVGLSYIVFRVIHVLIDVHQGAISERVSALKLFNYAFFFPAFLSGPIHRFEDHRKQERRLDSFAISSETLYEALLRVSNGYIKIIIDSFTLEVLFTNCRDWLFSNLQNSLLGAVHGIGSLAYFLHLYLNFSGYVDIVVGIGLLFGFRLPENFDRPFASGSFLEFWGRWHMTLSSWFRTYVFNPIVKALALSTDDYRWTPYLGALAYFITFLLVGIWHGSTYSSVLLGVMLGVGAGANKLYELLMGSLLGKERFKNLRSNGLYGALTGGLTIAYIAFSLTCLWLQIHQLRLLALNAGVLKTVESLGLMVAMLMAAFFVSHGIRALVNSTIHLTRDGGESWLVRQGFLAARVFLLTLLLFVYYGDVPEFVYVAY